MQEAVYVPLDSPMLQEGWWAVEREGNSLRGWTAGEVVLPLPTFVGPAVLEVRGETPPYPVAVARAA